MSKASRLKEARVRSGLTLAEVANRAHTTTSTVWRLEDGRRRLTADWIVRLAAAIGCSTADLVPNVEPTPNKASIWCSVGPEERVQPIEQITPKMVEVPFSSENLIGVEVSTRDLWPRYERGDVLFYRDLAQEPTSMIGRECVITTHVGSRYLKRLMVGSSPLFFRLVSHRAPDMEDIPVLQAFPVVWVKRVNT